jgi:signal transduction histidine kinase
LSAVTPTPAPLTPLYERSRPQSDTTDFGLRELMAVREIVHAFLMAEHPGEVFQFALDRVSPLVGASFACVYLIDGSSELMELAAVHNWPEKYTPFLGQMRVRVGFGPSGEAASERRMIEVPDVFADASLEDWQEVATELGFRSFVALPLQTPQAVLGTVTFYFGGPASVSPETRHLMRMVADQMAATAEKARLIDDLRHANMALTESNVALEHQYADLLEARRLKDEFLSNISHELRTPLTAVIGYISLMQEGIAGPITAEQQETLEQVKDSSEQLLGLIGDLLELTMLKRAELEVSLSEFDPRAPLRDALAGYAADRTNDVSLAVEMPDLLPSMTSDRQKIAKVLCGLLGNAFKFTHSGGVRASVEVSEDRVVYTIADTGIGIPADAHRYVFEEFRQVEGGMTRRYGGSGLGLALARRLTRLLGGDVQLESVPEQGSTFRVELPLVYDRPASTQ